MYDEICYKQAFLKEVIARVDFASQIDSLEKSVPSVIANAALERFPIIEERKALAQELLLLKEELHHKQRRFTEWNYHGRERQKRLAIAPEFAYVTYTKYSRYEELIDDFFTVISVLCQKYSDLRFARLGLRYINQIDINGHDPYNWEDIINPGLLGIFQQFANNQSSVNRLFHIVEFKYADDIQLKFQFGVPNPDFPAPLRAPLFVLDMDAYFEGLQNLENLREHLDSSHLHIQELFETSILDEFRRIINE